MKLYFMRHGKAEQLAESDHARPLTQAGAERVRTSARVLKRMKLGLDAIYSSPRVRARQTAEIVAGALGMEVQIRDELNFDFDVARVHQLINQTPDAKAILFVGHNPSMSEVVHRLSGANVDLKVGAVARIDLELPGPMGTLVWLATPRVFDALED